MKHWSLFGLGVLLIVVWTLQDLTQRGTPKRSARAVFSRWVRRVTVLLTNSLRALLYPSTLLGGEDPFYMPTFLRRDSKATNASDATEGAMTALVKTFGLLWLVIIILGVVGWVAEKMGHPLF